MFGKKSKTAMSLDLEPSEVARLIERRKLEQMGPIPQVVPAPPVLTFLAVLKHGMEPVTVKASRHTFGQVDCSRGVKSTDRYTHFIVDGQTTFVERVDYEYREGPRYRWAAVTNSDIVFSIRTDDVVMVAEEGHCGEPDVPTQS